MKTIVAPTTANSNLVNGVYFENGKFYNRYKDELSNTWVVFCFWSNENSRHGEDIANIRTAKFKSDYNIN